MRAGWAFTLVLAILVPGCATQVGLLSTTDESAAAGLLSFGAPQAMAQPTGGAEPNVAVLPDGTLFITAVAGSQERPNAMQGAAWLWRSTDNGTTWESLRAPQRDTPLGQAVGPVQTRRPFGSSDADVTTSPDGWTYYTDWWNWGAPVAVPGVSRYGSYLVEASGDGGKTWSAAPVTTLDSVGGIDRQWLVAKEGGFVLLAYAYFHGPQNAIRAAGDPFGRADSIMSIESVISTDHGASWSNPVPIVPPVPGHDLQIGHPRALPDGTLVMPYGDTEVTTEYWHAPSKVMLAVSKDNGTTWYHREVASAPQGFDNLWAVQGAVDAAGRAYVAWASRSGDNMTISFSESADAGDSWTEPTLVEAGGLHFLPWVAAWGDGQVAVGWYGNETLAGKPDEAADDAQWFAYAAVRAGEGQPFAIAKLDAEPVKVGPICPKGAACGANREILDYLSLAFEPSGRLVSAYAKSRDVSGVKAGQVVFVASS